MWIDKHFKKILVVFILMMMLYLYCMAINPWIEGGWEKVRRVLFHWQSLNVGILAFASTLMLFHIAQLKDINRTERELLASRALLPLALNEISEYLINSASLLDKCIQLEKLKKNKGSEASYFDLKTISLPVISNDFKDIFRDCMVKSDLELANYLAYILASLQVHNARLTSVYNVLVGKDRTIYTTHTIHGFMISVGEIVCLVNHLYGFARGEEDFYLKPLTEQTFKTAYLILRLHGQSDFLRILTKRKLESSRRKASWNLGNGNPQDEDSSAEIDANTK